jgi:hypothetical protein
MALQTSGAISLNNVNVELGNSGTAYITMGSTAVRGLFGVASGAISLSDGYGASSVVAITRGVIGGGYNSVKLDYITIASTGNSTSFGNLTGTNRQRLAGCSAGTRGVFGGGGATLSTIDYITIASTGNATAFGNLTVGRAGLGGVSSTVRGVFMGGFLAGDNVGLGTKNDYITIASTGNATFFGYLTVERAYVQSLSNDTRGITSAGNTGSAQIMDYITIASTGNATTFGNRVSGGHSSAGVSSATRGLFGGGNIGYAYYSQIDYITIASTGNATAFGYLSLGQNQQGSVDNNARGVWVGGFATYYLTTMEYVTIASTGNATAFGTLAGTDRAMLAGVEGG